jgi:hypothetical protein
MAEHSGKSQWYVRKGGRTRGPLPAGQIEREILLGRIRENDDLSTDSEHWHPLRSLLQLVPEVMRHSDTEEGRQHLLLARLRMDERLHDRRGSGYAPADTNRRHGDRRNVESFDVVTPRERDTGPAEKDERNLLLPAAVIMIALFVLATYFLWYRPAPSHGLRDCEAAPAPAVNWSGCDMPGRVLRRVDLSRANLSGTKLTGVDAHAAQLRAADLSFASLEEADLSSANLRAANLNGALLSGANLSLGDLRDADFGHASLQGANLHGAKLKGAKLGRAIWTDGRVCADGSVGECR